MPSVIDERQQWFDATTGELLVNGNVYIGTQGTDPTVPANQITIYSDRALSTVIGNPQLTDSNGQTVNKIWIPGKYSITVTNSADVSKYTELDNGLSTLFIGLTSMAGLQSVGEEGETVTLLSFHVGLDKGGGEFYYDTTESRANHNGITIIDPTNTADLVTWDAAAQTAWFTAGTGTGCWKRNLADTVSVLAAGAKFDGSTLDTLPIQYALRANAGTAKTSFPGGPSMVEGDSLIAGNSSKWGIQIPSDSTLIMDSGTILQLVTTTSPTYNILNIFQAENVVIKANGAQLIGDVDAAPVRDPGGNNGIGLRVQGSDNVFVYDLQCSKVYADGWTIVYDDTVAPLAPECNNVHFINCGGNFCERNGSSVIGCVGGSVRGGTYSNNNVSVPGAGIDVEPNAVVAQTGLPSTVADFEITGVVVNSNTQGIVCDAAGTVTELDINNNTARNNDYGILVHKASNSQVVYNKTHNNNLSDLLVYGAGTETTLVEGNTSGSAPLTNDTALNQNQKSQSLRLAESGVYTGVKVIDDANINFGTADFTIIVQAGLGDWSPTSEKYLFWKISGSSPNITGVLVAITQTGQIRIYLYRNDDGVSYTTLTGNHFPNQSVHTIGVSVSREASGVDGSISIYHDGRLVESLTVDAAAVTTLTNTGDIHIGGRATTAQQESALESVYLYNKALIKSDHVALYRDGVAEADKWSSCILALEPEGIQPEPGLWLDSSTNFNHGRHPVLESSLGRYKKEFEIRWSNTWAASAALQYVGDVNTPILPSGNIRIDSISMQASAGAVNINIGDGSAAAYFVSAHALAVGFNEATIVNRDHDATNRDMTITPSGAYTGTIDLLVRGIIS